MPVKRVFERSLGYRHEEHAQKFQDSIQLRLWHRASLLEEGAPLPVRLRSPCEVIGHHRVHGFICTNLTKKPNNPKILDALPPHGGLSGKVVDELSDKMISQIYRKTKGKYVIIGCGGVFSARDAYRKMALGASLIQLITGMIFEGPQLIGEINAGLVKLMDKKGFTSVSQIIGSENK